MNNDLLKIIKKHHLHPIGYQKIGKVYLIKEKDKRYILKLSTSNYDIYKYLISRDFHNFPDNYNTIGDNYDLSEYIPNIKLDNIQKLNDLLTTLSILHKKTSYKREISLDDIKKIYEDTLNKINEKLNYYTKINDLCDKKDFLSPSDYLLLINISLIYYSLEYSKNNLNKWYDNIKNNKSIRVSLIHNNISLDHFIVNQDKYLINWDKSMFDIPIFDILNYYKLYYKDISLNDLFMIYEKYNKLDVNEKELLLILLMIGNDLHFSNNELLNTKMLNDEIIFLQNIYDYNKDLIKKQ